MISHSRNNVHHPLQRTNGTIPWPPPKSSLNLTKNTSSPVPEEPSLFTEASKHAAWRAAMALKLQALLSNHTWDLVPPSPGLNVLGSKWVLKMKRCADGTLEHRKARLVAKRYHQQAGIDFSETYSPIVKPVIIHMVLSIADLLVALTSIGHPERVPSQRS
ncbi:uncharacterized mitochondrial protein AtMg00820-like [Carya illinoinensis]|uniref:uncharacterized mitochondrial protein AtMg00820-like n=1 Tax=Carya illinoinensis TaxID=32201 RepID=UPI001C71B4D7|nr:uncharacterized mitochondrial protein AtMg00820-like [Carya illinoinensis]